MKILLTGASGFLGKIVLEELSKQHEVITLGRTVSSNIVCDLSKEIPTTEKYDLVIHAAGKAHSIPKTEVEKKEFYNVNEQGTYNLLQALKHNPPTCLVFISTVAVYGREEGNLLNEEIALDGNTPYALSKIKAEELVTQFGKETRCNTVCLRLPLVVGKEAKGNLGSMIKAIQKGYYVRIGKGETKRSMVLANDVATFLPSLINKNGTFNLCDGIHPSYVLLENKIASHFHRKVKSLPLGLLKFMAKMGDVIPFSPLNSYRLKKLTASLTFSDTKAREELGWKPNSVLDSDFLV